MPSVPGTPIVDAELIGSWVATKGNPVGVIAEFKPDGTFTWSNRGTKGTYSADGSTLTFMYAQDSGFCALGTLGWTYDISGDTLTSDGLGFQCPGGPPLEGEPGSPDWIFQRQ